MNIGFDAKRLYCNFSGLGNYSRTLVENLIKYASKNNYNLYTPSIVECEETLFFKQHSQITTYNANKKLNPFWRSFGISNQLKKDAIEIYHGLSNELPLNIYKSEIKSVVTIHDLIFKIYPKNYKKIDNEIYDFKFRNSCKKATKIIAISEATKSDIIKYYKIPKDKIEVIYQSCNSIYYQENPLNYDLIKDYNLPSDFFLFVGSTENRKNLIKIIEAYKLLPKTDQIPLIIVGKKKSNKSIIDKLINAYNLSNYFIWLENVSDNKKLQQLYKHAVALIYPSFYEGFGLPIVEALLSKTPVITSNVSAMPEAGGPASLYINPNDQKDIAAAIKKIINTTELRKEMKLKGYKYAMDNFAPKVISKQILGLYENVKQIK